MKQTTIKALLRVYARLEEIATDLYTLADTAVEMGDFEDASLLQARADILYEQIETLDFVISVEG